MDKKINNTKMNLGGILEKNKRYKGIVLISILCLMLSACNKSDGNVAPNPSTIPISTNVEKKTTLADIMKPVRYIADGERRYIDSDWLNERDWWSEEANAIDFNAYQDKGLLLPNGKIAEDTICIADFNTKKAEYVLFETNTITIPEILSHLILGNLEFVQYEKTDDGYAVAIHTHLTDGTENSYVLRYFKENGDVFYESLTDTNNSRLYQLGYSSEIDFELIDISDQIADATLKLCACGCDDVLGTCTEDEDCTDPVDGCIDEDDIIILD